MDKTTVYLAGKITGDPYYRMKFFDAARELEAAGFIVMNPALLPSEGFAYEAYLRMSSAMLDECEAVCFLPDWTDSNGAMFEFGRAAAQGKHVFMFAAWQGEQDKATPEFIITQEKTEKTAFRCLACEKVNVFPAWSGDGRPCWYCGGHIVPIGYAKKGGNGHAAE